MPEVQAMAEGEALRWNREARLANWIVSMIPYGVARGISACFEKDSELPEIPEIPDYFKLDEDG